MDPIHHIPLDQIDATALPRDRLDLDPIALSDLTLSIAAHGLRMPIEVFPATGPLPYGLISGYRRLLAHRELNLPTIPAFIRQPADIPAALAAMIEENEIRAEITPWERASILLTALEHGHFATLDDALPVLYPTYDRFRRARLRAVVEVVQHFGPTLTEPLSLSQQKLTRLAAGLRAGLGPVMDVALAESSDRSPATQWSLLSAILDEMEEEARHPPPPYRKNRPRHYLRTAMSLTIRRERHKDGWLLRFTGRDASGPLMEDVMDYVEAWLGGRCGGRLRAGSGRSLRTNTVRLLPPKPEIGRFQGDHWEFEERILWLCIQVSSQLCFMSPNARLSWSNFSLMIRANA